jgi:hypothetical protein
MFKMFKPLSPPLVAGAELKMMMITTLFHAHNTAFSTHLLMSEGCSRGRAWSEK